MMRNFILVLSFCLILISYFASFGCSTSEPDNVVIKVDKEIITDYDYYTISHGTLIVVKNDVKYYYGNYTVIVTPKNKN